LASLFFNLEEIKMHGEAKFGLLLYSGIAAITALGILSSILPQKSTTSDEAFVLSKIYKGEAVNAFPLSPLVVISFLIFLVGILIYNKLIQKN